VFTECSLRNNNPICTAQVCQMTLEALNNNNNNNNNNNPVTAERMLGSKEFNAGSV